MLYTTISVIFRFVAVDMHGFSHLPLNFLACTIDHFHAAPFYLMHRIFTVHVLCNRRLGKVRQPYSALVFLFSDTDCTLCFPNLFHPACFTFDGIDSVSHSVFSKSVFHII